MNSIERPPQQVREWAGTKAILGTIATILAVASLLWLSYALRAVALLVVLAILYSYVLAPVVALIETPFHWGGKTRGLSRGGAIAVVYTALISFIGGGIYWLVPRVMHQLGALDSQMPMVVAARNGWSDQLLEKYHSYHLPGAMRDAIDQVVVQALASAKESGHEMLLESVGLFRFLPWLILIPVISIFLLKDAPNFRISVLRLLPEGRVRWRGREFFEDMNQTIAFYVRAQLLACLFIGVVCTIGFLIIRVPYALLLGVMAGMLDMIPLIGPLLTGICAGLVAGSQSAEVSVYTVMFLVVLRGVHDNVVYPRLIASGIKLHPLTVILALLCGAQLAGGIGLFLAIPLTAFLSVSARHLSRQWHGHGLFAEILEAREPEPLPLPPVRDVAEVPNPTSPQTAPLASVRVLAVDDDEDGQMLLALLLERQGAEVTTAGSVAEALQMLEAGTFDILLSDIGMPGEDGFELIRRVRATKNEIPAAALTGYDTPEDRDRALVSGFDRHLGKPIDAAELLRTMVALAELAKGRKSGKKS